MRNPTKIEAVSLGVLNKIWGWEPTSMIFKSSQDRFIFTFENTDSGENETIHPPERVMSDDGFCRTVRAMRAEGFDFGKAAYENRRFYVWTNYKTGEHGRSLELGPMYPHDFDSEIILFQESALHVRRLGKPWEIFYDILNDLGMDKFDIWKGNRPGSGEKK